LLETQLTVRPERTVPLPSFGTAVRTWVSPATIGVVGADRVTVATGASVTVIEDVPVLVSLVAVIVTGPPADVPVTRPFASTVATAELLELHVIRRPASSLLAASRRVAASCCVPPTTRPADEGLTVTVATGTVLTVIAGVGLELTDSLIAVI
jgi:hypothetical protein